MGKKDNNRSNRRKEHDPAMEVDHEFNAYIRAIAEKDLSFESDEEKKMLIDNFIQAIPENKEEAVAQHALGSKIIETLIGYSSPESFENFTKCLSSRKIYTDVKATFLLEACVKIACLRALTEGNADNIKDEEEDLEPTAKKGKFTKRSTDVDYNLKLDVKIDHVNYCNGFVIRLSKFVLNNIEDLLTSQGNHFVRTCILSLAGIVTIKSHDRNASNQINLITEHKKIVPVEWTEIVCDFATRIMQWPQFAELAFDEKSSTFLQVLCQALSNLEQTDELKKLIKSIMKKCFEEPENDETNEEAVEIETLKPFSCKSSQFLLETIIQYSDDKQYSKIYKKYFKSNLIAMCDSSFNFTVQRLLDFIKNKEIFEEIFNQITSHFSELLQNGKTGVVLAMCKACDRLNFKQGQFIQSLLKALGCERSQTHVIQCIVALVPLQIAETKSEIDVHLHGSLILQHILHFNKPIKIVQNLLDMKPQNLSDILCHQKGSRIADAYLDSKFIGEKSREKLIKHLESMYLKLALSRNGSHVLEKLYQISTEGQKETIVKELAERTSQLNSSQSGKIISYKFNVPAYVRHPNQWRNFFTRSDEKPAV